MKKAIISKMTDLLTEEFLSEIGEENLTSIDPDAIDVIVQKTIDEIESTVYDKILIRLNTELASYADHWEKWW